MVRSALPAALALALCACNPGPGPKKLTWMGETLKKERTWAYQEWLKGVLYVPEGESAQSARTQLGVLFSQRANGKYLHDYAMEEYRKAGVLEEHRTVNGLVACKVGTLTQGDRQFVAVHACGEHQGGIAGICLEDDEVVDLRAACPARDQACFKRLCSDRMDLVLPALEGVRLGALGSLSW